MYIADYYKWQERTTSQLNDQICLISEKMVNIFLLF